MIRFSLFISISPIFSSLNSIYGKETSRILPDDDFLGMPNALILMALLYASVDCFYMIFSIAVVIFFIFAADIVDNVISSISKVSSTLFPSVLILAE